jgi:zinc protease
MTKAATIVSQVDESSPIPGVRLFIIPTKIKDAVFITGSFLGGAVHSRKNRLVALVAAELLDEGTKKRSRRAFRERFESIGASIEFSADMFRTNVAARCLKEQVPLILALVAEALREPRFGAGELAAVKLRLIATIEQDKDNTRSRAESRLLALLYPREHPNFRLGHDEAIRLIRRITREDIVAFHREVYGLGNILLVAAGDVDKATLGKEVARAFGRWKPSPVLSYERSIEANTPERTDETIHVPDKANVDIYIGGPAHISDRDPDYVPFSFGLTVLGGTFFGRLMQSIREEKGLTYGIRAMLGGASDTLDGYWAVWSTFAPIFLERGKEAIREELKKWVDQGITADELVTFKETIRGAYTVGLGTAAGFAEAVLGTAEQGRPLSYLDDYLVRVESLTRDEVNEAIRAHVDPDKAVTVAAGAIKM